MIRIRHQNRSGWFIIPELDLVSPVGNGAVVGAWNVVEDIVELRASGHREPVVSGVIPGPVGQDDSRTDA